MRIFRKTNVPTWVHKNGHNSTYDQYFLKKLAIGFSTHRAIIPFYKISQVVPFLRAGYILYIMFGKGSSMYYVPIKFWANIANAWLPATNIIMVTSKCHN